MSSILQLPSLAELISVGAHYGHKKGKWHPKMAKFIFGERSGVHIINLEKTVEYLGKALEVMRVAASQNKVIVFVGTKPQAKTIIGEVALSCRMPYVKERWVGGTMTNFPIIHNVIKKYLDLKAKKEQGALEKYTKKEQLTISRQIEKLQVIIGGISSLTRIPDYLFVVDVKKERTAIREARKMNIPVIGLCDTNTNPKGIAYPIPVNDDSVGSIELVLRLAAQAVLAGKDEIKTPVTKI